MVTLHSPFTIVGEASFFGDVQTTLYIVRDESHYVGEIVDTYFDVQNLPLWENATVVTKINETLLWKYTTPTEGKYDNLTCLLAESQHP